MNIRTWLVVAAAGLLGTGCSRGLEGVGAGATAEQDAARCAAAAAGIGLNLRTSPTKHFLLLSGGQPAQDRATGQFLDEVADRFNRSFAHAGFALWPPPDRLVCVCLDSYRELDAYGRQADGAEVSWMDGYYSYRTNRVAVVRTGGGPRDRVDGAARAPGVAAAYASSGESAAGEGLNLRTATHELAHQLAFNSGLQRRDAAYPFWLTEGLATNFEADGQACGLGQVSSRHRGRLAQARAAGRLLPLARFAGMADPPAGDDGALRDAYAQAWALFAYLLQRRPGALREFLRFPASLPGGPADGEFLRRFEAAFGPADSVQREYLAYVDTLSGGTMP